jgi:hypothetical protein
MKLLIIVGFLFFAPVFTHAQSESPKQDSLPNGGTNTQRSLSEKTSNLNAGEIAALVRETGERMTRMNAIIFYNYLFVQADIEYELDKRGQTAREKSKVYEIYPVRGRSPVRVQLSEDGKPFSSEKIERERERAAAELVEAEKKLARTQNQSASVAAAQPPDKRFYSIGIGLAQRTLGGKINLPIRPTDFLVSHEFYAARPTMFDNRETILMSFRPRPNFVFDKSHVTFQEGLEDFNRIMARLGGRIWIDAADKTIVRLEASPVQESNFAEAVKSDAPNTDVPLGFEFTRLPNGVWSPSRNWLNSYGRENVFGKLAVVNQARQYSDFKLFSTEVKDVEINQPKTQP